MIERPNFLPLTDQPTLEQVIVTGVYLLNLEIEQQRNLRQREFYQEIVGVDKPSVHQRKIALAVGRELSRFVGPVKTNDNETLIRKINGETIRTQSVIIGS